MEVVGHLEGFVPDLEDLSVWCENRAQEPCYKTAKGAAVWGCTQETGWSLSQGAGGEQRFKHMAVFELDPKRQHFY